MALDPPDAYLIDGDVGAPHDAGSLIERDIEFVGHQLTEAGASALAGVGLTDIKRRRVVLMNHDPRVEFPRIDKRIGARTVGGRAAGRSQADE